MATETFKICWPHRCAFSPSCVWILLACLWSQHVSWLLLNFACMFVFSACCFMCKPACVFISRGVSDQTSRFVFGLGPWSGWSSWCYCTDVRSFGWVSWLVWAWLWSWPRWYLDCTINVDFDLKYISGCITLCSPGFCQSSSRRRFPRTMPSCQRDLWPDTNEVAADGFLVLLHIFDCMYFAWISCFFSICPPITEDQLIVTLLSREGNGHAEAAILSRQFARQLTPPRHGLENAVSRNLYRRHRDRSRSRDRGHLYRWQRVQIANERVEKIALHVESWISELACFSVFKTCFLHGISYFFVCIAT